MKYRYENNLEYSIYITPEIENIIIPKVVLEQIVENSFKHRDYKNGSLIMISVSSAVSDNQWTVSATDNGSGFEKDKLEELKEKFEGIKCQLSKNRRHLELEIGGMGLVNVYARLYLHFRESLLFDIQSDENGSTITFGSNLGCKENEIPSACGR